MTDQAQADTSYTPTLVIFGKDDSGKAHASSFEECDAALAKKAASLMGMRILPVQTDVERAIAAKVPKGKVFASGKGFVPFVKADLFAKIEAIAPAPEPSAPPEPNLSAENADASETADTMDEADDAALLADAAPIAAQPTSWNDIQVGAIVLSAAVPGQMDWFECLVLSIEGEDRYKLRYCDWPTEPAFIHHISEIGLLHPSRQPEPAIEAEPAKAA